MSQPFDLDAFAREFSRPMQLVTAIKGVTPDSMGVTLYGATTRFDRRWRDRYGTLVEIGVPGDPGEAVIMRAEFVTPTLFRFRMIPGTALPENHTPMIADDFAPAPFTARIEVTDETITLCSTVLTVRITRKPFRICVTDAEGKPLFHTLPAAVFQHPPTGESHLDGASITDAWPWFFRDLFPMGFIRGENGLTQSFFTASIHHDEHFYGFGEKFGTLDKRGQAINLWHANATGNTWAASYKNIPFFLSSQGYGLYINSAYPIKYHMGDLSHTHYSAHLQHELLDFTIIGGGTYKNIIAHYTELTGRAPLPPLWSFGLWMSRMSYREQSEVEAVAQGMRENDVPCDVIHIDTDWFATPWVNDLTFSPERFPDPRGMITRLRDKGFRVTLWQIPYIATESVFYAEGIEKGYFAKREDGTPWLIDGFFGKTAVMDYSNPDGVRWMQSKFDALFEMGVAAIKTDFGEGAPSDARYATVDGLQMHNLYPLLYNRAIWEYTRAKTGEGIVWGRSAYAGSQRYPVQWGGDPAALWEDLGNLWHGGLGLGLCGFLFWSVDIGGFGGTPTPKLYVRWAQAGLFVSHPRAHGPIAREPWRFGADALRIFRDYAKLRYRLMPYVWSSAYESVRSALPLMRPLMLDWQDDPNTAGIDDQWLFGEHLLVAPILDESDSRRVYLPAGRWYDWWTGAVAHDADYGRWISVNAPLEHLPLYARGGGIIPMCDDMAHTGEKAWNPITLRVYPRGESTFMLIDRDEGIGYRCVESGEGVAVEIGAHTRAHHVQVFLATQPASVQVNGRAADWSYEGGSARVTVEGAARIEIG